MGDWILKKIKSLDEDIKNYEGTDEDVLAYMQGRLDQCNEILDIYYS
jgi:hypothetical protein